MPVDEVRLSAAVMTHPARADRARELAELIPELHPVCVVDDSGPERGNLANAVRAWEAVGVDATHHLVLQDDVILCDRFVERVLAAARARPGDAISLFCEWGSRSANLVRMAAWRDLSWARAVDMYTPSQGLIMPRAMALDFVADVDDPTGADDLALSSFLRRGGHSSVVTVPNLVEHDDHPSLTGNGFQGLRRSACPDGADARRAVGTAVAGEGLAWLPYASWMRVHAEWFYCGAEADFAWLGRFADTMLPKGLRRADLGEDFSDDLVRAHSALPRTISELTLFEYWTTYFALGLAMPEPVGAPGALADTAFGTAFPGLFRRYLPMNTVDALASAAGDLATTAFRRGMEADIERPAPQWYGEENPA